MWGANDPDCRKPMVWDDIAYEPETTRADGSSREPDTVEVNSDLLEFYTKLIGIRKEHPALLHGSYRRLLADDSRNLLVFEREASGERIVVALNNSEHSQVLLLEGNQERWVDLLRGTEHRASVEIPPRWGAILSLQASPQR